jgi:hypothetical protein
VKPETIISGFLGCSWYIRENQFAGKLTLNFTRSRKKIARDSKIVVGCQSHLKSFSKLCMAKIYSFFSSLRLTRAIPKNSENWNNFRIKPWRPIKNLRNDMKNLTNENLCNSLNRKLINQTKQIFIRNSLCKLSFYMFLSLAVFAIYIPYTTNLTSKDQGKIKDMSNFN